MLLTRTSKFGSPAAALWQSWDWSRYADLFVKDATYNEHLYGKMSGRERIREWIVSTMNAFPGSEMPFYPASWYSVDIEKGWIGLWSYEEDAYNPMNFMPMWQEYVERCQKCGTLSEDGVTFAKNMGWQP